jgi:hypothetical protein
METCLLLRVREPFTGLTHLKAVAVKGCSRTDSIVLGQQVVVIREDLNNAYT